MALRKSIEEFLVVWRSREGWLAAARLSWMAPGALFLGLFVAGCGGNSADDVEKTPAAPARTAVTGPPPEEGHLLFVLRGPAKVTNDGPDGQRIEVNTEAVEWFTTRPARKAGIADADAFVDRWKDYGFAADPPNAAVSGPGTDAVVELKEPATTARGIAFVSVAVRGELAATRHRRLTFFIDDSTWHCYLELLESSDYPLTLVSASLPHGKWVTKPPSTLSWPFTIDAKADGFMTGCEMWVTYKNRSGGTAKMHIDWPYAGSPHSSCTPSGSIGCVDEGSSDNYYGRTYLVG